VLLVAVAWVENLTIKANSSQERPPQ
jgi:hypothetical protein